MGDKRISELPEAKNIKLESNLQSPRSKAAQEVVDTTPTLEAHMDEICDICGDVGEVELIITCGQCNINCEHWYCMRIRPADYPENWCCEECEAKASSLNAPEKVQCHFDRPSELPNDSRQNPVDHKKKIPTGKVKPLSTEEVIMLTSGASNCCPPVKISLNPSTSHHKRKSMLENTPKAGGIPPKSDPQVVPRDPSLLLPRQLRLPIVGQQETQPFGGLREKGATQAPLVKQSRQEYIQRGQFETAIKVNANIERAQNTVGKPSTASTSASPLSNKPIDDSGKNVISGEKVATLVPLEKQTQSQKEFVRKERSVNAIINNADIRRAQFAVENRSVASISTLPLRIVQPIVSSGLAVSSDMIADPRTASACASPEVSDCLYVPATDASWKGSFNVHLSSTNQGEITGGIEAHSPSPVGRKIYDFTKLMPDVLRFELVERGSLWMNLFENHYPDRRDIGLYLFPSTSERCKDYMSLLGYIEKEDLAVRVYMDGRELFIFTSKLLSTDCQRWNGMYFLWGVFRRLKLSINSINQSQDEGENDQVVDMEINMIGEVSVGSMNIAIPRMPLLLTPQNIANETLYGIPPGFEKICGLKVPTSHSPAEKGGFGGGLKVERRPGEEGASSRKDESAQTPAKPMLSSILDFENPRKNVKSEFQ